MTRQDQQMIDGLISRIRSTQITDRDPEAAARLQQGLGNNPDAIYILAQTVLVQQHSLEQAHAQLEQMESQLQQTEAQLNQARQQPPQQPQFTTQPPQPQPTSWLDRFFGNSPQQAPAYAQQQPPYSSPQPGYQPVNTPPPSYGYAPQPYPPQGYGYGAPQAWGQSTGMGGGSFLRNAAQTAAGVAAGEMLFQGVESMFGERRHEGFGGGREHDGSITNNYYEDRPAEHEHHAAADSNDSFYNPSHDASRDTSNSAQDFADTSDDSAQGDGSVEDHDFDDSSSDDSTSSDDSN